MGYPIWWDTPLTIYNQYEDPTTHNVTWYRHYIVMDGVGCSFWKDTGEKLIIGNTSIMTDAIICRIPAHYLFVEKYAWDQLPVTSKQSRFTLCPGDIIVRGLVADTIIRATDLISKYKKLQGCMVIDKVTLDDSATRGMPHYYVRGT